MCQSKTDKIFKDLPNVFSIAKDILVIGYDSDSKDHAVKSSTNMQTGPPD